MNRRRCLLYAFAALNTGEIACGGDTVGKPSITPPIPIDTTPQRPAVAFETSYGNAKGLNIGPQTIPQPGVNHSNAAHAFADFFRRGQLDLFVANKTYDNFKPIDQATPATFEFWRRQSDGTFVRDTTALPDAVGCVQPRKAIVADFNHDGQPDVFVACTGYDNPPYPGESSAVILSQSNGTYITRWIPFTAYMHGAAAGDITGSGHIDIVAVNPLSGAGSHVPVVLVNDGMGNFTARTDLLPAAIRGFIYSVEVLDLNGDKRPDILFMGDDAPQFATGSTILINDGSGTFRSVAPRALPGVTETLPYDAVLVDRELYLLRTSSVQPTFWSNRILQRVDLDTGASVVVDSQSTPAYYVDWLLLYTSGGHTQLVSDNGAFPYTFLLK